MFYRWLQRAGTLVIRVPGWCRRGRRLAFWENAVQQKPHLLEPEGRQQYGEGGVIRKGGKEEMVPGEWAGGREVVSSSLRGTLWETETLFVTKL